MSIGKGHPRIGAQDARAGYTVHSEQPGGLSSGDEGSGPAARRGVTGFGADPRCRPQSGSWKYGFGSQEHKGGPAAMRGE